MKHRLWLVMCVVVEGLITGAEHTGDEQHSSRARSQTYRAAVFEHQPIYEHEEPLMIMLDNVRVYAKNAALAAKQGAKIIVFPEYGVTGLGVGARFLADLYAQDVPDPTHFQWNACKEPAKFKGNSKVIEELSCIALNNSIVVVANLITRVPCDSNCPKDNQFLFNTNLIFSSNGTLLATYHKHHLFMENYLDPSPKPEYVIVDLGFVRVGTFVCFDIMFADPAIQLIEKYGIRNIVFPTNWVDMFPHFASIQMFHSYAYGLGINLLAADLFAPKSGSIGSGIYSSTLGALNETYDLATPGRLLIADIPVNPNPVEINLNSNTIKTISLFKHFDEHRYSVKKLKEIPEMAFVDVPSSNPVGKIHRVLYEDLTIFDYKFLTHNEGAVSLCHNKICCQSVYKLGKRGNETYALIAFSGMTGMTTDFYIEICGIVRCETNDITKCGWVPEKDTQTQFQSLILNGNFSTQYLYPNIFSAKLTQIKPSIWKTFMHEKSSRTLGLIKTDETLYAMTIMGRIYYDHIGTTSNPYESFGHLIIEGFEQHMAL